MEVANGAGCFETKVWTDTMQFTNMRLRLRAEWV